MPLAVHSVEAPHVHDWFGKARRLELESRRKPPAKGSVTSRHQSLVRRGTGQWDGRWGWKKQGWGEGADIGRAHPTSHTARSGSSQQPFQVVVTAPHVKGEEGPERERTNLAQGHSTASKQQKQDGSPGTWALKPFARPPLQVEKRDGKNIRALNLMHPWLQSSCLSFNLVRPVTPSQG